MITFLKNIPKYLFSSAVGRISKGIKNEFELATVNEPTMFEPLKFFSIDTCSPGALVISYMIGHRGAHVLKLLFALEAFLLTYTPNIA